MMAAMPRYRTRNQNVCACGCGRLAPIVYLKSGRRKGHVAHYRRFVPGHGNKDWGRRQRLRPIGATDRQAIGATRIHNARPGLAYRQIKAGPGRKGWRFEHRVVMEHHLGRPLLRSEHVHHKNHDTLDNRIENLELMTPSEHHREHFTLHGGWSKKFAKCRECGTTDRRHLSHGLCTACYQRRRYQANPEHFRARSRIAGFAFRARARQNRK